MMETFFAFLKKLTENLGLKLISLGLAFLLWLFVVSIENPVMNMSFSSIPITIENADVMVEQGKAFELADSSHSVTVTVKAERSVLSELSRDNIKATVDMTELEGNRVPIDVKVTRYADRVQSVNPAKEFANVIIEDLAYSQFRIQVEPTGSVMDGYSVGSTSLQNNVVRVSGPESVVSSIAEAVAKVNVSGMTSEIHTAVPILLLDEDGDAVDTSSLDVSLDQVNASVEIWKVVEVPVSAGHSGTPAAGYVFTGSITASPASIYVTGDNSALNALTTISIPATELDISGAAGDVIKEINISTYLPSGVYLESSRSDGNITLTADIDEAASAVVQVPYSNLTVQGMPDGMVMGNDLASSMVAVTIRGLQASLDGINGSGLTGTLNLSGITKDENGNVTPGSYAGEVILALPEGITQDTAIAHVLLQMDGAVSNTDEDGNVTDGADTGEDGDDRDTESDNEGGNT